MLCESNGTVTSIFERLARTFTNISTASNKNLNIHSWELGAEYQLQALTRLAEVNKCEREDTAALD